MCGGAVNQAEVKSFKLHHMLLCSIAEQFGHTPCRSTAFYKSAVAVPTDEALCSLLLQGAHVKSSVHPPPPLEECCWLATLN